ncbi:nuclear transport factor 2 family protein [Streptomyces chilikensis]|uniref:Nuclear transport factor 2 family protein n=1 Tax=Streptomyces chilikensis TaxID=1194079 RepID=A0ABV3EJJ2_9ACTN
MAQSLPRPDGARWWPRPSGRAQGGGRLRRRAGGRSSFCTSSARRCRRQALHHSSWTVFRPGVCGLWPRRSAGRRVTIPTGRSPAGSAGQELVVPPLRGLPFLHARSCPPGAVHGRGAVLARVRQGMAPFARTVRLGTNTVIEVDGGRATARGAQLSTHVLADGSDSVFVSAGHAGTELVRTADGWRISATALRIASTRGTPPQLPEEFAPAAGI